MAPFAAGPLFPNRQAKAPKSWTTSKDGSHPSPSKQLRPLHPENLNELDLVQVIKTEGPYGNTMNTYQPNFKNAWELAWPPSPYCPVPPHAKRPNKPLNVEESAQQLLKQMDLQRARRGAAPVPKFSVSAPAQGLSSYRASGSPKSPAKSPTKSVRPTGYGGSRAPAPPKKLLDPGEKAPRAAAESTTKPRTPQVRLRNKMQAVARLVKIGGRATGNRRLDAVQEKEEKKRVKVRLEERHAFMELINAKNLDWSMLDFRKLETEEHVARIDLADDCIEALTDALREVKIETQKAHTQSELRRSEGAHRKALVQEELREAKQLRLKLSRDQVLLTTQHIESQARLDIVKFEESEWVVIIQSGFDAMGVLKNKEKSAAAKTKSGPQTLPQSPLKAFHSGPASLPSPFKPAPPQVEVLQNRFFIYEINEGEAKARLAIEEMEFGSRLDIPKHILTYIESSARNILYLEQVEHLEDIIRHQFATPIENMARWILRCRMVDRLERQERLGLVLQEGIAADMIATERWQGVQFEAFWQQEGEESLELLSTGVVSEQDCFRDLRKLSNAKAFMAIECLHLDDLERIARNRMSVEELEGLEECMRNVSFGEEDQEWTTLFKEAEEAGIVTSTPPPDEPEQAVEDAPAEGNDPVPADSESKAVDDK